MPDTASRRSPHKIAAWRDLEPLSPRHALVAGVDLVVVRHPESSADPHGVSVLYGRCHHRGALLADGFVDGDNLICGVHHWDYRYDTGISEYNNAERLEKFACFVEGDDVLVELGGDFEFAADDQVYVCGSNEAVGEFAKESD